VPKIKTKKSASKRMKITGTGKIMHAKTFSGCHHILTKKSAKRKRSFRLLAVASPSDQERLKILAPYLK
jgi:large subunit ribosomal protein L35